MTESWTSTYGSWGVVAGASEGLGAAFAEGLAKRGLNLLLLARRSALLDEQKARLEAAYKVTVRTASVDLADPKLAETLESLTSGLDVGVAVYNAAFAPIGNFLDRSLDELMRVVDVNVRGPLVFARTLAPKMVSRGKGGLVLMSSLAGYQGAPRIATYAASKAFNIVLGEGLWSELSPLGVHVVVSAAGAIRTPGYQKSAKGDAPGTLDANVVAEATLKSLSSGGSIVPGATNQFARFFLGRMISRKAAIGIMAANTKDLT